MSVAPVYLLLVFTSGFAYGIRDLSLVCYDKPLRLGNLHVGLTSHLVRLSKALPSIFRTFLPEESGRISIDALHRATTSPERK
ncbi:hypothetical protein BDZ94DRAFT_1315254 [Collybia nuda]|uniref:Uncharacterized protein n=1 Tax=Collybia nuda TaxID=64659 RepID=A0A9P6C8T1_9AGAR|nr:hypothetical protein BDZ94DRAFT_1315254 [Collybia nuda]